jgi:putative oxidoreductase
MNADRIPFESLRSKSSPIDVIHSCVRFFERIPDSFLELCARVFPAAIFWQSGRTKVQGWALSDNAMTLFREDYQLPLIDPVAAAHIAAVAEHVFPVLLVIGFLSRLSALALLLMTFVIKIFVYSDAWPTHGVWATCLLLVVVRGPGALSVDRLIFDRKR